MPKRLILALVCIIVAVSLAAPTATAAVPSRTVLPKGAHLVTVPENSPQALPAGTYLTFNNHVYLRNVRTGKCMGVAGGSIGNGALVLQWTCAHIPGSDQQMHVRQYQTGNPWNVIDPSHSPGKCLGVAGSSQAPGAALVQWSCNQSETDQQFAFRVTNLNNPIRVEIFARHSEQVIGVAGANPNDGAQVVQWPRAGDFLGGCVGDQCWDILLN